MKAWVQWDPVYDWNDFQLQHESNPGLPEEQEAFKWRF